MKGQIRLSESLIKKAKIFAAAEGREPNQQIEYWAHIGQLVLNFPDTPYSALQGMLLGIAESEAGEYSDLEWSEIHEDSENESVSGHGAKTETLST